MKSIIRVLITFVFVFGFGLQGCYDEFAKDNDFSVIFFGNQRPLRTVVTRSNQDELVFKIGVGLGGLRDNKTGYQVDYRIDTDLFTEVDGAESLVLLPADCYTGIDKTGVNTFVIPKGKMIGDCPIKINKDKFVNLSGSLGIKYALPLRLLTATATADSVPAGKDWTIIVIKYVDEKSGTYYCKGWQGEWDKVKNAVDRRTVQAYSKYDWSQNKTRVLTTRSLSVFDMAGMGNLSGNEPTDHLLINLVNGQVTLESTTYTEKDKDTGVTVTKNCNAIVDMGSSYNPQTKIFTLDYFYTKGEKTYKVFEELKLRQDVEKDLKFEVWAEEKKEEEPQE